MWQWPWTQATPTMSDPTTIPIGLLRSILRSDQPERAKAAMAILGAVTLCSCMVVLTLAVWYQAVMPPNRVDGQLVIALLGVSGSVAILAGNAYRKKEDPATPAPTTEQQ